MDMPEEPELGLGGGRGRRAIPLIAAALAVIVVASLLYLRSSVPASSTAPEPPVPTPIPHLSGSYSASFDFIDASRGWALLVGYGESHRLSIFGTTDGAAHWRRLFDAGVPSDFDSFRFGNSYIHFFDSLRGFAWAGSLYRTVDGGKTWIAVSPPGAGPYLTMVSAMQGWALPLLDGADGGLLTTSDGGSTWTHVPSRLPPALLVDEVGTAGELAFRADGVGWLGSSQKTAKAYVTADGGASWREVAFAATPGAQVYTTGVRLLPGGGVLVVVYTPGGPEVARASFDGGASWRQVLFPPPPALITDLSFVDASHWWAARFGFLFKTDDGGRTWTQVPRADLPEGWSVQQAHVIDSQHAWWTMVATSDSREIALMTTSDGGRTWRAVGVPAPA